jgi:hypothetical protein
MPLTRDQISALTRLELPSCTQPIYSGTGFRGDKRLMVDVREVDVLANHWNPFFVEIAGKYGLTEDTLRETFKAKG